MFCPGYYELPQPAAASLPSPRPQPRAAPARLHKGCAKPQRDVTKREIGHFASTNARLRDTQLKRNMKEKRLLRQTHNKPLFVFAVDFYSLSLSPPPSSPPSPNPWFSRDSDLVQLLLEVTSTLRLCRSDSCTVCWAAGCSAPAHPCSKFY